MRRRLAPLCILAVCVLAVSTAGQDRKRAITHDDYDAWPSIRSPAYSPDGKWIAYSVDPTWGDGVLHVRQVDGDAEHTYPLGSGPRFSADGRYVIFAVKKSAVEERKKKLEKLWGTGGKELEAEAKKEEAEQAAAAAARRQQMMARFGRGRRGGARGGGEGSSGGTGKLAILDVTTGKVEVIEKTKGFRVVKKGELLIYHLPAPEPKPDANKPNAAATGGKGTEKASEKAPEKPAAGPAREGRRGRGARRPGGRGQGAGRRGAGRQPGGGQAGAGQPVGGRGTRGEGNGNTPRAGTRLVVRQLATGKETQYEGVLSYRTVAKDEWLLLTCAFAPPKPESNRASKTGEPAEQSAGKPATGKAQANGNPNAEQSAVEDRDGLYAVQLAHGKKVTLVRGAASFASFTTDLHNKRLAFTSDVTDKLAAAARKKAADAKKAEAKKQAEAKKPAETKKPAEAKELVGAAAPQAQPGSKAKAKAKAKASEPVQPKEPASEPKVAGEPKTAVAPKAVAPKKGKEPKPRHEIFLWDFDDKAARRVVTATTRGVPGDAEIQSSGLGFSTDGSVLAFGIKDKPAPELPKILPEEKVVVDIWHWNDGSIQPMQAKRRGTDNPTRSCVVHLDDARVVVLGDKDVPSVSLLNRDGSRGLATDGKPYEKLVTWDGRHSDVYVVNTTDGSRRKIVTMLRGSVQTSPSGRYMLYFGLDYQWYSIDLETYDERCLTQGIDSQFHNVMEDRPQPASAYGIVGWTKGEKEVLVNDRYDIWKIDPATGAAVNLTDGYGRANQIVLRYSRFDLEGDDDELDPETRRYLPDTLLLSAKNDRTKARGYYTDSLVATARPKKLIMVDRALGGLSRAAKAERLFFTQSTFAEFPDIWVADMQFGNRRKLTDACPRQRDVRWGTSELVGWTNGDGVDLQGILVKPDGFDPKRKYPMMVYFYERNSDNVHRYIKPAPGTSPNAAYYVSNGYLWFVPDIVYTVGYPGESAEKCVITGVQHLIAQGFVDRHAIGIAGHSWGGYQTAHLVTRTNMFAAAESGAPVSNMFSAYGGIRYQSGMSRQFQYERTQSRIGGTPWEYPQRYWQNSPVFYADRVKTPVLILHNDNDGAVPWTNGIEFFMALRRLGKEAYLFNYNGEPHGLRKMANQKDWARRMSEFFDHHLKGVPAPKWMQEGVRYADREREKIQFAPSYLDYQKYLEKQAELKPQPAPQPSEQPSQQPSQSSSRSAAVSPANTTAAGAAGSGKLP